MDVQQFLPGFEASYGAEIKEILDAVGDVGTARLKLESKLITFVRAYGNGWDRAILEGQADEAWRARGANKEQVRRYLLAILSDKE